jgi:ssRNA-specific RNase YbeY (16S rRNA maturation enzyme)
LPALTEAVVEDIRRSIYLGPWRVDIVRRAGVQTPLSGSAIARQVQRGLRAARASEPASVAVVLTDDAELTDLNREHMGIDGPTDVLSFPMLEPDAFLRDGAPKQRRGKRPLARAGGRTHIGDIAISV